ncbi:hypothetical protein [Streptococcus agalactiae]|uniref:hypothetical protein n=1 Tax=Streptococcus agalactiae TaxID=1311 RepID=UPI000A33B796|nr:hypothetical protein [Streptococcus agalactiae]OTG44186.1 hypothetical protein B7936_09735 [Streptococcus agalactiae]OTG44827.1 hypothetical protein B7935_10370 [Streptococcus agalactiae]RRA84743.1 hypothetical protein D5F91_07610 [Streptococcus agalactiae]RRA88277.1 hypothetical protein D5F88_00430 [Streptococcus agalactiae]
MEQYFKDFESKLQNAEEKLDILGEWHIAKGHDGASDIAEQCRTAITDLWIEFYKLSEAYTQAEASHEEVLEANMESLLGELKRYDDERSSRYQKAPNWLFFNILDIAIRSFDEGCAKDSTTNIWLYLRGLIVRDLKDRGVIEKVIQDRKTRDWNIVMSEAEA